MTMPTPDFLFRSSQILRSWIFGPPKMAIFGHLARTIDFYEILIRKLERSPQKTPIWVKMRVRTDIVEAIWGTTSPGV